MKRLLIVLLTVILSLSLAAFIGCEDNKTNAGQNNSGDEIPDESQPNGGEQTDDENDDKEITEMYVYVNGNRLEVTLAKNSAVNDLTELLKQGDITYTAYTNGFEIYGDIGHDLSTSNAQITSEAGDVLLWAGSNICIFFGNNSYSYTRIGKINGYSAQELRNLLGAGGGSIQVTLSLN